MKRQVTLASSAFLAVLGVLLISFGNSALINAEEVAWLWAGASWLLGGALFYGTLNVLLTYLNEKIPNVDLLNVEVDEEPEVGPDES